MPKSFIIILFLLTFNNFYLLSKEIKADRIDSYLTIDGKLDEPQWHTAESKDDFLAKDPIEGATPSEKTEIKFLYNDKYFYIGARMHRENPKMIQSFVSRKDNMGNSERIIISLDTYFNKTSAYTFAITATGVRADYYHSTDSEGDRDYNFNPVWTGKTNIDSLGWTAEIKIPFSQLRFRNDDTLVWGLNVNQYTPTNREDIYWVVIPKNEVGWASRFGTLKGISGIGQTNRFEFLPYISIGADVNAISDKDNPFKQEYSSKINAGLDFKMGFGPNATLDVTINPDFGQVEADPAVVNLSEFETYFDEKRVFFIEGNKLFQNTGVNYYYSRRIGAAPVRTINSDYCSMPFQTTILGAGKVTGRTKGGASYAVLSSLTSKETGDFFNTGDSVSFSANIAPMSLFSIARLSQELDNFGSNIGGIVTVVNRDNSQETSKHYNDAAYSGGIDWRIFTNEKKYSFSGNLGFSHVAASKERISFLQRQTTHLTQKPDAKHLTFDSTAESLSGFLTNFTFAKNTGTNWLWNVSFYSESPGLDFNDFGRLMHNDEIKFSGQLRYRENRPSKYFHHYSFSLYSHYQMNWGLLRLETPVNFDASFNFVNRHSLSIGFNYNGISYSDTRTRGGISVAIPAHTYYYGSYSSDWSRPYQYRLSHSGILGLLDRRRLEYSASIEYNYNRWKFVLSSGYTYSTEPRQFVGSFAGGSEHTFLNRYVFAKLKQNTISSGIRINYSLTPDFTFELYSAPFISNGKYMTFGEMKSPRSYQWREYGVAEGTALSEENGYVVVEDGNSKFNITKRDFLYKSFRSSAVLRWEYKAGCIIYAVWQINNSDYINYAERITGRDYFSTANSPGINSFMLKISYWLSGN